MGSLPYGLRPFLLGGGQVRPSDERGFRLVLPPARRRYADAQVDDCKERRRSEFRWSPPISLRLRAQASHASTPGTLGFGFWNDPFGLSFGGVRRLPAPPEAIWFFYGSPLNDFTFAEGGSGHGWKAASLRSAAIPPALLLPAAAAAFLSSRLPLVGPTVVRSVKRKVAGAEAILSTPLDEWHEYRLVWQTDAVQFEVDGELALDAPITSRGPLGFVAWIDNQYAVLSESRGIRFGVVPTEEPAWLEVADLEIG